MSTKVRESCKERTFVVSVPVECMQLYMISAKCATEAKRLVNAGGGDPCGWVTGTHGLASRAIEEKAR